VSASPLDLTRVTTLTFDCYGTLIDWEAGVIDVLRPLLARCGIAQSDDEIVATFQDIEAPLCEPPYRSYRTVLADVIERFGRRFGFPLGYAEREALAVSVASWRPFPDTVRALRALEARYRLAIISNIDDDLFETTVPQLGVFFDCVVTAQAARCYKPDQAIFELALGRLGVKGHQVAHVAEGVTEISPARRLGCATVWVRRRGRSARLLTEVPDLEVPDLSSLLPEMGIDAGGIVV
jgi:2-haloacid dehalogenase